MFCIMRSLTLDSLNACVSMDAYDGCDCDIFSPVEYLRGFETFAETSFIISQGCSRSFEWQGCGLKLHIPEGSVPAEHKECRIDARAGFSGQFTFPDDSQLVSCVYWLSCSHKFLTPVTLEIQHCTSLHDPSRFSSLQFVAAKSSEPELPYQFRALDKGTFSPHSTYGSIQVSQFSFFGIISDKAHRKLRLLSAPCC